jgi:hypothetical protein
MSLNAALAACKAARRLGAGAQSRVDVVRCNKKVGANVSEGLKKMPADDI